MIESDEDFFPDDMGSDDYGLDKLPDNVMTQFEADKKLLVALCKMAKISVEENLALRRMMDRIVIAKNENGPLFS